MTSFDENFEKNRKVCLRFLKEVGLLSKWEEFVQKNNMCDKISINNWFQRIRADMVFGQSTFTKFLETHYEKYIENDDKITQIFRAYALYILKNDKLIDPEKIIAKNGCKIDKISNTITINYKKT